VIKPLPYQEEGLAHIVKVLTENLHCLEASSTGWGKTYVALMAAKQLGLRPAILCRKIAIPMWEDVCFQAGLFPVFIANFESCKSPKFHCGGWKRKNKVYEWIVPEDTLMIFDEAHRYQDPLRGNSKLAIATLKQRIKTIFLTATPMTSPLTMYTFGRCFRFFQCYRSFKLWCYTQGVMQGAYSMEFTGTPEYLEKHMTNIGKLIFPKFGHRVTWRDVPGFPETITNTVSVVGQNSKELRYLFDRLHALRETDEELPIVDLLRARQFAELEKVPAMAEMATRYIDEGKAVAVFLNFNDSITAFTKLLNKDDSYGLITGDNTHERAQVSEDFQSNKLPMLVCNVKAGGESVNMHDLHGKQRVSLISPSYSGPDLVQVLGRIHRAGAKSPALQHIFFVRETREDDVRKSVDQKLKNLDSLLDADLNPF